MELNPKKAYLITTSGSVTEITPRDGREFELEEAQVRVEGYVEIVQLSEEVIMIINEEGKYTKGLNAVATGIANSHGALWYGDYICGNVVICPSRMFT
ncbi:MAG: DUF3846 domain-containing protein [Bacteroidales bacterium]|nr:DUF3846 domain-containing protein [Bacteroidales bacterium]